MTATSQPPRARAILLGVVAFVALLAAGAGVFYFVRDAQRREVVSRVTADIESLRPRRPAGLSARHWDHVVGMSKTAVANCCFGGGVRSWPDFERFAGELHPRAAAGPVDLQLIDWIWDNLARTTFIGQNYSDRFRPTNPEEMKQWEEEAGSR